MFIKSAPKHLGKSWPPPPSGQCPYFKKTWRESQKAALRTTHQLLRCQVVYTKRCHYYFCHHCYCPYCHYYYCHNFSFWVVTILFFFIFFTIWAFEFDFFNFVTTGVFEFCHNLSFWVLLQFDFLIFTTIWVFEFCHNLSFEFLKLVIFSFVTIWVFEFGHNLNFWVLSQFEFLSFWVLVFELSQFVFLSFVTV